MTIKVNLVHSLSFVKVKGRLILLQLALHWLEMICKEVLLNLFMAKLPFNFISFIQVILQQYEKKGAWSREHWSALLLIYTTEITRLNAGQHKQGCWRLSCDRRDNSNVWSLLSVSFLHFLCLRTRHIKTPTTIAITTMPPTTLPTTPPMIAHRLPAEPE